MRAEVGQKVVKTVPSFAFMHPVNKAAHCGAITYMLMGGNKSYLSFMSIKQELTLWSMTVADLSGGKQTVYQHKVKAYPANYMTSYVEANFKVTLDPSCVLTGY